MSENDETPTEAPEPPAAPEPEAPAPAPRRTLRERLAGTGDRVYGVRGLVAATLAALIVGGFGGAAIHAAVDDGPHSDRFHRPGGLGRDFGGRMGWGERPDGPGDFERQAPPGFPGPVPPTTTPEDEESSPTPSPSESSDS